MSISMLDVRDIDVYHGDLQALNKVSLTIEDKEIVAIVGSNGAGKSTVLNSIMGLHPVSSGRILFKDQSINGRAPEEIVRMGMTLTPERRQIFSGLTIAENLRLGASARRDRKAVSATLDMVFGLFPILFQRRHQQGGTLSGGQQQRVAVARALAPKPKFVLADEPTANLDAQSTRGLLDIMQQLNEKEGTTFIFSTHDPRVIERARRVIVFEDGKVAEDRIQ